MTKKKEINKNLPPEEEKRWKLFYDYACKIYKVDEERYKRIEEKALACLTAFSLLLVIYSLLWKHILDKTLNTQSVTDVVFFALSVILLLFFWVSWIQAFQTFKTEQRKGMPLHEHMVKYFKDTDEDGKRRNNLSDLYFNVGEINREAYEENFDITEKKLKKYKKTFQMIRYSAFAFLLFVIAYFTYSGKNLIIQLLKLKGGQ